MEIPLAQTGLRPKDIDSAIRVLQSGNLTMGAEVKRFEKLMAAYLGTKNFIMVNSGSSANLALFEALIRPSSGKCQLSPGDGILVPIIAWPTTIWPIVQLGLIPHFIDVDISNLRIDLIKAQKYLEESSSPIKGIFVIHPLGYGTQQMALQIFAQENSLVLLNDVCESLGSHDGEIHAGTLGTAATFSFYYSHHITTLEGGGIATNDDALAEDLRSIRSHGWARDRSDWGNWMGDLLSSDAKFQFVSTGFNIRPLEIQAAIGTSQMEDIETFLAIRRKNAKHFYENIQNIKGLRLIGAEVFTSEEHEKSHSWMMLPVILDKELPILRKKIVSTLNTMGIDTRPVLSGNFLKQPASKKIFGHIHKQTKFHAADFLSNNGFLIGNSHDRTFFELDNISVILEKIITEYQ